MTIIVKNKDTLIYDGFSFKWCIGKNGFSKNKIEGDKKTPKGTFYLGNIFYRQDRKLKPFSKLKSLKIKKNMGCVMIQIQKSYNKLTNTNSK